MTKVKNKKKIDLSGILQPLTAYRFRVIFSKPETLLMTQQVMNCSFNFVENEFRIKLRQPITKGMISTINSLCKGYLSITVDTLDGQLDSSFFSIYLSHCKCIDHSFKLDYATKSPAIAVHDLVFEYSYLKEIDPVEQKKME